MAQIQYTSRIVSTAADGVLVETSYIKDEAHGKLQSEINFELYSKIESQASVYNPKGSIDSYDDLPLEGNSNGDVYNVIAEVTIGDKTYPHHSNFVWTSGEWKYLGISIDNTEAKNYSDSRLQEYKDEVSGKLTEIKTQIEDILEESKTYTDNQFINYLSWIEEDEDLL